MSSSSREFLMMREEEETGQLYVPALPKKDIKKKAQEDVKTLLDGGNTDIAEAYTDATRISEYLKTFVSELKDHLTPEQYGKSYEVKGAEISFRGTGDRLDYDSDTTYSDIKKQLKDREELLKLAYKSKDVIYDSDGAEVPKVGIKTPSKETVVIKY